MMPAFPVTRILALCGAALSVAPHTLWAQESAVEAVVVERRPVLMGTVARMVAEGGSREQALGTLAELEATLRAAEAELSTWQAGTELDRFNRGPIGEPVTLSAGLDGELARALECSASTQGTFDPTIGALIQAWDLRGAGRLPSKDELEQALDRGGRHHLERTADGWIRRRELVIDEGGFGKGAALDRGRLQLARGSARRVLVDLGGQLLLVDPRPGHEPWTVAVADPDDRSVPVLALTLPAGSVATSSNSERSVTPSAGGAEVTVGHLLDPRTGRPAADFGSVTVWAPTALEADCLATGLFVAGPDAALELAADRPGIEVVVLERAGRRLDVRVSDGMRARVEVISDRVSLLDSTHIKERLSRESSHARRADTMSPHL